MNKLISIKESTRYPGLFVHKYKKQVFYRNLWNEDPNLLESRGHVYDKNGECVIRPFTKIFNYRENATTIEDNEKCLAVEKINGFMACATNIPDKGVVVSTTGSLDSKYVDMAKEMMPYALYVLELNGPGATYIFEIVHPDDPHIIQENIGVYLLGARSVKRTNRYFSTEKEQVLLDMAAQSLRVSRPHWCNDISFERAKQFAEVSRMEGYVVYGQQSHTVLKLKSPYYTALKVLARCNTLGPTVERRIPEQFRDLLRKAEQERAEFLALEEQERLHKLRIWV